MKQRFLTYIFMLTGLAACSEKADAPSEYGTLRVALSSEVAAEVLTKAEDVDLSAYTIYLSGTHTGNDPYQRQFVYGEMTAPLSLPYGLYSVEAESCTSESAHSSNDGFGCPRYYGKTDDVRVMSEETVTVTVDCKMANSCATVAFGDGLLDEFDSESVSVALTVGERTLTVTWGDYKDKVAYFNVAEVGSLLTYVISGKIDGTGLTYSSSLLLQPAKHAHINIGSNHNGILGPDVSIQDEGEIGSVELEGVIDPAEGDQITGGAIDKPMIYVDYTVNDAVYIDCLIDVIK